MTLTVIGTGFGRTGTVSMRVVLDLLGVGPCHHMRALMADAGHKALWRSKVAHGTPGWDVLFDGFGACVDWPSAHYWPELIKVYPDAKVLLTWRPAESWWNSFSRTILKVIEKSAAEPDPPPGSQLIKQQVFGGKELSKSHCIATYEANVARVRAEVSPERLLIHEPGDGWGPLCAHLGVAIPDTPYPHVNSTASFQTDMANQ